MESVFNWASNILKLSSDTDCSCFLAAVERSMATSEGAEDFPSDLVDQHLFSLAACAHLSFHLLFLLFSLRRGICGPFWWNICTVWCDLGSYNVKTDGSTRARTSLTWKSCWYKFDDTADSFFTVRIDDEFDRIHIELNHFISNHLRGLFVYSDIIFAGRHVFFLSHRYYVFSLKY